MKRKLLYFLLLAGVSMSAEAQTEITTAAQLQAINDNLSGSYKLMNDIDLTTIDGTFTPIGTESPFKGSFDGNGHTIKVSSSKFPSQTWLALFGEIGTTGTVFNLKVEGSIGNKSYRNELLGGIASLNRGTITNCWVQANISVYMKGGSDTYYLWNGGIAGTNYGTISYCTMTGYNNNGLNTEVKMGGIAGETMSGSTISYCTKFGDLTSTTDLTGATMGRICGKVNTGATLQYNYYSIDYTNHTTGLGGGMADGTKCEGLNDWYINGLTIPGGIFYNTTNQMFIDGIMSVNMNPSKPIYGFAFTESDGKEKFDYVYAHGQGAYPNFKRAFTKDVKCTICMPFNISIPNMPNIGKFYEFKGIKDGTTDVAQMQEVTNTLYANKAYVFEPNADISAETGIFFTNGSGSTVQEPIPAYDATSTFQFMGTYTSKTWEAGDADLGKVYGFAISGYESDGFTAGQFVLLGEGASAAPFRAYLKYVPGASAAPKRAPVSLPNVIKIEWISADDATSISTVNRPTSESEWFTLDGRKLNGTPATKGIYVNNGKKVLVK